VDLQLLELGAALLAAIGVGAFFVGVRDTFHQIQVNRRVATYASLDRPDIPEILLPDRTPAQVGLALNRRLTRSSYGANLQARLVRAGLTLKASDFILLQAAAAAIAALLARLTAPGGPIARLAVTLAFAALGFVAPLLVVSVRERQRLGKFEKQLAPAVEAMAGTLQAGSTLPQSMEIISRELPAPISEEFRRVLREMELGLAFTDSLANMLRRVPSTDLILLTSAISIQSRVGGDLAEILRSIAHTIRERLRIRSEISVLTAQGRYSTYLISALPVLLFTYLYFTKYDYASQLFLPGVTRLLLILGITGIVVGFYAMRRIISVDV
jgi:tight adherence protein B